MCQMPIARGSLVGSIQSGSRFVYRQQQETLTGRWHRVSESDSVGGTALVHVSEGPVE